MKFKIFAGLSGGFGGANYCSTEEYDSLEAAGQDAYEQACEIYDSYEGLHGLRDTSQIIEEDLQGEGYSDLSEDELYEIAWEIYCEERDSWLDYYVKEVVDEEQEDEND